MRRYVFVSVRQNQRGQIVGVLIQKIKIRNRNINSVRRFFGKTHSSVDNYHFISEANAHTIHSEFADSAQRYYFQFTHSFIYPSLVKSNDEFNTFAVLPLCAAVFYVSWRQQVHSVNLELDNLRGVDSPANGFGEVVNSVVFVENNSAHRRKYQDLLRRMFISFCERFFLLQIAERKTMFLEFIAELVCEIIFEGFFDFVIDYVSHYFANRRK